MPRHRSDSHPSSPRPQSVIELPSDRLSTATDPPAALAGAVPGILMGSNDSVGLSGA